MASVSRHGAAVSAPAFVIRRPFTIIPSTQYVAEGSMTPAGGGVSRSD